MTFAMDNCVVRYNTADGTPAKIGNRKYSDTTTLFDMLSLRGTWYAYACLFEHDPTLPPGSIFIEC